MKKKILGLVIFLIGISFPSLAQATEIEPLYFDYISGGAGLNYDSLQDAEWNYLMKFKMFGQEGIMFNGTNIKVPDESGWFGTSTGGFTLKNGNHVVGGPILIGNNIRFSDGDGSEVFSTGPVRVLENLYYANWNNPTDNPNIMAGPICIQKDIYRCEGNGCNASPTSFINTVPYDNRHFNSGNLNGNPAYNDYNSCPDSIPEVKTSLKIPRLSLPEGVSYENAMTAQSSNSVIYIDVPPAESSKDIYDRYIEKISLYAESKLIVRMQPGGRLTRIFLKDGIFFENHGRIQIMYMDDVTKYSESAGWSNATGSIVNNKDYNGNLLFYTTAGFSWAARVSTDTLQGTFITTGLIQIKQQMTLAGQLLADSIFIDANFDGSGFIYVQFNPPELNIDPQLLNEGRWPETGLDSIVPIHLDTVPVTDVKFSYCFAVKDTTRETVPAHVASVQDFQKTEKSKFPVCGVDTAHVLIKEGKLEPTDDTKIYINVITDTLTEGDEDLTLKIFGLAGAVMPGNKKSGEFVLKITDMPTPKFNNDDTDPYNQLENTPNTLAADGDVVKEIKLKNMTWERKDSILVEMRDTNLAAGAISATQLFEFVLDADETAHSTQALIRVKDASKLDYETIESSYDVVLTLKHMKEDPANPGTSAYYVVDTLIRTIRIIDVNEAPTIRSIYDAKTPSVLMFDTLRPSENLAKDSAIGVVLAEDPDTKSEGRFSHLDYFIDETNGAVPFAMRKDTIVVTDPSMLNYEVDSVFKFNVRVQNCDWDVAHNIALPGGTCHEVSKEVVVKLQNEPEDPKIECLEGDDNCNGPYVVIENSKLDSVIHTFVVSDEDIGQVARLTASLTDNNGRNAKDLFNAVVEQASTGEWLLKIVTAGDIDYETIDPSYSVKVTVTDADNLSASIDRVLNIVDVNETPSITGVIEKNADYTGTQEPFTLYPKENLKNGDSVGVVIATDPDTKNVIKFGHLEYSIIDPNGTVPFVMSDSSILVKDESKMNYEQNSEFTFDVKVTNCEWDVQNNRATDRCLDTTQTVVVKIQNVPEDPVITCKTGDTNCNGPYDVIENSKRDSVIHEFVVTDDDLNQVAHLTATLTDNTIGGNASSLFKAVVEQATTGEWLLKIVTAGDIDYENIESSYSVKVTVEDSEGLTASIDRILNIVDVNETPSITGLIEKNEDYNGPVGEFTLFPKENLKNGDSVGVVIATDPDTKNVEKFGHLEYSIIDPNGTVPFVMSDSSILVKDESKMNHEQNSTFTFDVKVTNCEWDVQNNRATDRCLDTTQTVVVKIQNVPEDPVITCKTGDTNCNGPYDVIENSKRDSVIHEFVVTDDDLDQVAHLTATLTDNTIGGNASSLFKAVVEQATTGEWLLKIVTAGDIDYETIDPSYSVKVTVTDADNLSASIDRILNIVDVNETPSVAGLIGKNSNYTGTPAAFTLYPKENLKNGDSVGVVVATDPDTKNVIKFGHLEYSIIDPNGTIPFVMSDSSILVKDESKMNHEQNSTFTFDVKVTNCEWDVQNNRATDRCLDTTQTIVVRIQNVPEEPVITCKVGDTNCYGPYDVIENSKRDSVIHEFIVTDDDNGQVASLDVELTDNNGRNAKDLFKAVVEQATTGEWLLKIVTAGDIDYETIDPSYSVKVTVTDADNLSASINRVLNIVDVNEAPTVKDFNETIKENLPNDSKVGELEAADPDVKNDAFSTLTYTIVEEGVPFKLDSNVIKVADSSKLNYEKDSIFTFHVNVSDGTYSAIATVTIKLSDENETPKIIVDDDDDGDDDTDSLCIANCDTTGRGSEPGKVLSVGVDENVPTATIVFAYTVFDEDLGDVGNLTPSFTDKKNAGADSLFKIELVTDGGKTKLVMSVLDSAKLDYEKISQVYELTVYVTDLNGAKDSLERIIKVRDVNEAPTVEPFDKTIEENLPNNAVVGELVAADPDTAKAFSTLTYTIVEENIPFVLDSNVIKVADGSRLNYEKDSTFAFHVIVSDGNLSDTALVTIKLKDLDEKPKIIVDDDDDGDDDSEDDSLCIAHCDTTNRGSGDDHGKDILTVGVNENSPTGTVVLQYYVYDEDADDVNTLIPSLGQIGTNVTTGVTVDDIFEINKVKEDDRWKIVVTVKDPDLLDYEELRAARSSSDPEPQFTVAVIVSEPDGHKAELKDTIIRVIQIRDMNESPLFTVETCEIAENNQIGDSLGRIEHPSDIDSMSKIVDYYDNQFRLVGGDTALFDLRYDEPIDGRPNITLIAKVVFDCESEPYKNKCGLDSAFHVVIDYFDKNDTTIKTTHDVPIKLIDVNEKPKITTDSVEVKENVEKGTVVDTIKATDPDVYDSVLTYTLVEDKSGCFDVSARGVITVKVDNCPALDYEKNHELPITVKVTDNGTDGEGEETLSDTKTIYVKITDVNEKPNIPDQAITVSEDTEVGTEVGEIEASDPDTSKAYGTLTYELVEESTTFEVKEDGTIILKDTLDYEKDSVYTIKVRVTDGELSDTATVTIKIGNVVETPEVEITRAETVDSTWKSPDTLYINTVDLCIDWEARNKKSGAVLKDTTECMVLDEGKNVIVKKFEDPSMDNPGYDTLVVYVSRATPIVSIRKAEDDASVPNIFTVVEESAQADTAFYVNERKNDIIVTVTDPESGSKETFTTKIELDTVSVPTKTFTSTMAGITDFGLALTDNPSSGTSRTPVNGEKIAVSYTEVVNGHKVTVTYYTDDKGEPIANDDGVVEMTVAYKDTIGGHEVTISYQADAVTGAVIKTSGGYAKPEDSAIESSSSGKDGSSSSGKDDKSSSSKGSDKKFENEVVFTVSYETVDEAGNAMTVSYGVDAEGNIVRNEDGNIGYLLTYTYKNKFGNTGTQSLFIVLDQVPPKVKILYPAEGEIVYSNFVDVKWTVDIGDGRGPIVQDTLITQSLVKGGNPIVRFYRDKAGNEASDTVRIIMKNAKDVDIAIEKPVTEVTQDRVAEYYATHEPEDKQTFAVTIYNPKTDKEVETVIGGGFDNKPGTGEEPYPGLTGHLGPTLGIETKVPTVNSVGGLATLDDIIGKDGLVPLEGVEANTSKKVSVEQYVRDYCTDEFAENVGSDLSRANLFKTKMYVKVWIYTTLGDFVDYYSFTQELDNPDYMNDAGLLTLYFEMKPDRDGNVRTASGRLLGTGAYVYRTEVEMKSTLRCSVPPFKETDGGWAPEKESNRVGAARSVKEDLLKNFGYKRPEKK